MTNYGDEFVPFQKERGHQALEAAAPQLLAACKEAKEFLLPYLTEPGRTVFWNLVSAIRRAEGKNP